MPEVYLSRVDKDVIKLILFTMSIPFTGIFLMVFVGDFKVDSTSFPKETWLWISIAFLWGMIFGKFIPKVRHF